ncbi:MAG: hypothetical protein ABSB84_07605 [Verrucomicrobiota bacterium]|jgi:hypothetical protein
MRPIFVIYLAAGITLLFAVLNTAAYAGYAYVTHHAIAILKPEGDDLSKMQAVQSQDLDLAAEGCVLALLQTGIIISARKLKKQATPPNT